jgi:circadian clock protein KaiC
MRSIGMDLQPFIDNGLLKIDASRPMVYGLEMHLITLRSLIDTFEPSVVIIDPISNLTNAGIRSDVQFMLTRLIDYLKLKGITAMCTGLVEDESEGMYAGGISSLMDTWINLRFIEINGELNRGLSIIKSRGMPHSNQIRECRLTDRGIEIEDVYIGPSGGLLMGSAKAVQEAKEMADTIAESRYVARRKRELESKLKSLDAQMVSLRSEFDMQEEELNKLTSEEELRTEVLAKERKEMARRRGSGVPK